MDDSNNTQATATTCARCADWKTHKKVCASLAAAASNGASTSTSKNLDVPIPNPFTRLTQRTWLHDRSERDTYKLLIDAYRLRMEDDYNFTGDVDADCRLQRVAPDLLPAWWNAEKEEECKRVGVRDGVWESLSAAPEKADFIEHYGDSRMPMQLRMFAEAVYGSGPGGQDGNVMMEMMARSEGGGGGGLGMSTIDMSSIISGLGGRR
ncbi:hypothetical protein DBV05_g9251 [Lasiodiplodia theobromae]|uniref:MYND-type zinc finger protein samB n=1 Tax=Lasiodiplodia theobromae TaxID=45133 RepID=A0A5N5D338_9PEZI|nr:hypothetical protein DBV05_g9251 [Lasiodiplodia theobromae]